MLEVVDQHFVAVAAGDDEVFAVRPQCQRRQGGQAEAVRALLDDAGFKVQAFGGQQQVGFAEGSAWRPYWWVSCAGSAATPWNWASSTRPSKPKSLMFAVAAAPAVAV